MATEPRGDQPVAMPPLTLPEELLLLSHEKFTGRLISAWGLRNRAIVRLNRALLAAGLLELILQDRIIPLQNSREANLLLYRFAPDDGPLPTAYTNDLWKILVPHIPNDLFYPFRRIVRFVQTDPQFGEGFDMPDQTQLVGTALRWRGAFDNLKDTFKTGKIPSFFVSEPTVAQINHCLSETILGSAIDTEPRTKFLLGLLAACDLLRFVFEKHHVLAEARTRQICRFAHEPETPIGNAYAFIQRQDYAELDAQTQ